MLWAMSRAYQEKPSSLLGIEDPWLAWQLDLAVMTGGQPETGKTHPPRFSPPPGGFGSVKSMAGKRGVRKIKLPKSGVW